MPTLTIESLGSFDIPAGKRLIKAILDDARGDQHYSCGGFAKCTSCRVQIISGEPAKITQAELDLVAAGKFQPQPGERLSCQCTVDADMTIKLLVPKPPAKTPNIPEDAIYAAAGVGRPVINATKVSGWHGLYSSRVCRTLEDTA